MILSPTKFKKNMDLQGAFKTICDTLCSKEEYRSLYSRLTFYVNLPFSARIAAKELQNIEDDVEDGIKPLHVLLLEAVGTDGMIASETVSDMFALLMNCALKFTDYSCMDGRGNYNHDRLASIKEKIVHAKQSGVKVSIERTGVSAQPERSFFGMNGNRIVSSNSTPNTLTLYIVISTDYYNIQSPTPEEIYSLERLL